MRAFIEEYGIAILVVAVLVMLFLMCTPVGKQVKNSMMSSTNEVVYDDVGNEGTTYRDGIGNTTPSGTTKETCIVNYDLNGGTGVIASEKADKGRIYTVSTKTPEKSGFTFSGWIDPSNNSVSPGMMIQLPQETTFTLKANWVSTGALTVSYNANGGSVKSGSISSQVKSGSNNIIITDAVLEKSGYSFIGWSTKNNATKAEYTAGNVFNGTTSTTLYAVFVAGDSKVSYDMNGGSNGPYPAYFTKVTGKNYTLSSKSPTRYGYSFLGWSDDKNATTAKWSPGGSYNLEGERTIYAIWKAKTYTVTFNANGGSGNMTDGVKTHGVDYVIPTGTFTKSGYAFAGWARSSNSYRASSTYAPGKAYTENKNITLYAYWEAADYTIEYKGETSDVTGLPDKTFKKAGKTVYISQTIPTRAGFTFNGWSGSDGKTYNGGEAYTANSNLTLTAKWTATTLNVTYIGGSGITNMPSNTTCASGTSFKLTSTVPKKTGYIFAGWSLNNLGTGTLYAPSQVYGTLTSNITFYAMFTPSTFEINFQGNGGSGLPSNIKKAYGVDCVLPTTIPVKEGYTFLGWSLTYSSTTATWFAGGAFSYNTTNSIIVLYAIWGNGDYVISFNANGGEDPPTTLAVKGQTSFVFPTETPTRVGYDFKGWALKDNATTGYSAGSTYSSGVSKNTTFYAVWKAKTYTITFNANGGSLGGVSSTLSKTHGTTLKLPTGYPTKNGYSFIGWSKDSGSTFADYSSGADYDEEGDRTLYAIWGTNVNTLTFDANGGVDAPVAIKGSYGSVIGIPYTTPTKEGANFVGWNTSKSAKVAEYNPGDSYTMNGDKTLYAVWSSKTYTIIFDANGGTGAPGNQIKTHGQGITLSGTRPTLPGSQFLGWSLSSYATTVDYEANVYYDREGDAILYAVWKSDSYTITYNTNGGSGTYTNLTKTHGVDIQLSSVEPTRSGYAFKGWALDKNAQLGTWQAGGMFDLDKTCTIYAIWGETNIVVQYVANTGKSSDESSVPANQLKLKGEDLVLTTDIPTNTQNPDYKFKEWNTSASGDGTSYIRGSLYSEDKSMTLYAIWIAEGYTVSYNANAPTSEVSNLPSPQIKEKDKTLKLTTSTPQRTGYDFVSWNTLSNGTGTSYTSGSDYTANEGADLFAQWKLKTYTITYNANGGTGGPTTQDKTHGVDLVLTTSTPTYSGREFEGWNTKSDGTGTTYASGATYTANEAITLFAKWKESVKAVAVMNSTAGTLTLYYDSTDHSSEGTVYDIPTNSTSLSDVPWLDGFTTNITTVNITDSFKNYRPTSIAYWFANKTYDEDTYLSTINGISNLDTSEVTNMKGLFMGDFPLSVDVSSFDTSKVVNMDYTFNGTTVSGYENLNVSSVTTMFETFANSQNTYLDLSSWNTSKVTDMSYMFFNARYLSTLDVSSFNTNIVTNMNSMFQSCCGLSTLDVSSFNTSNVTNMSDMFRHNTNLKTIYVGTNWSTSKVSSSTNMFNRCTSLVGGAGTTCDGTNNIDKTYARIDYAGNPGYLTYKNYTSTLSPQAIVSGDSMTFINSSTKYTTSDTFKGNSITAVYDVPLDFTVTSYDIWSTFNLYLYSEDFAVPDITKYTGTKPGWFNLSSKDNETGAKEPATVSAIDNVKHIVIDSSFSTVTPTSLDCWFADFSYATDITGLQYLNMSKVTSTKFMFYCFNSYNEPKDNMNINLDLSQLDMSHVQNIDGMFQIIGGGSKSLTVNVTWNTTSLQSAYGAFCGFGSTWPSDTETCAADTVTLIGLSSWNTSNLTKMKHMFYLGSIKEIMKDADGSWSLGDISGWDVSNASDSSKALWMGSYSGSDFSFTYSIKNNNPE